VNPLEERRAVRRYKLALQVEIRLESEPISGMTRYSVSWLLFRIGQRLSAGKKFGFSIMPPWEFTQATRAFISGRARVVRVEEIWDGTAHHMGVGAVMEGYKFGLSESSGGAAIQE
jgi:hypothetical protein